MRRAASISGLSPAPALQYAYKLLSYRGRSEREMAEKLRKKGFDERDIMKTVSRLRETALLDDRKLASSLKRYATESKYLGIRGIRKFLNDRGVPSDIANDIMQNIDEEETAVKFAEKKIKKMEKESARLMTRKLYGMLSRKGFSYETIGKVLRQLKLLETIE